MQSKTAWIGIGAVILALLAAGYFLGIKRSATKVPQSVTITPIITPTPTPTPEQKPGVEGEKNTVREITIEAKEFSYSTKKISVKKGEKIKLTLVNKGRTSHDFKVEGTNISTKLTGAGTTESIEFTINEAGNYAFFCSVGNHRAMGMEGVLNVD